MEDFQMAWSLSLITDFEGIDMNKKIVVDPLTRVSGFLRIEVNIDNGKIVDARVVGTMFRGFEAMLKGRSPLDAVYFTERICGICSTAHSYVSVQALEQAMNIKVQPQGKLMRDFIHGAEFLQNHIRHFYLYTLPDYIKGPKLNPVYNSDLKDYRLPEEINLRISEHYMEALRYSREAHEMLALLGGKVPHNHGIYLGGVTSNINPMKYEQLRLKLREIKAFIKNKMLEDVITIGKYYKDYFIKGATGEKFLSYGLFDDYLEKELSYVKPLVMIRGEVYDFHSENIKEGIEASWYSLAEDKAIKDDMDKKEGYSFVKSPRYSGHSMEVGPLARMILSGIYNEGMATMNRVTARVLEALKVADIMTELLERIMDNYRKGIINEFVTYRVPKEAKGAAYRDTTRGALSHFTVIKDNLIDYYDIITPSAWNLGPTMPEGEKGVVEKALIGTEIEDINNPVEIGRIVRSFDPCISCGTHVYRDGEKYLEYVITG